MFFSPVGVSFMNQTMQISLDKFLFMFVQIFVHTTEMSKRKVHCSYREIYEQLGANPWNRCEMTAENWKINFLIKSKELLESL